MWLALSCSLLSLLFLCPGTCGVAVALQTISAWGIRCTQLLKEASLRMRKPFETVQTCIFHESARSALPPVQGTTLQLTTYVAQLTITVLQAHNVCSPSYDELSYLKIQLCMLPLGMAMSVKQPFQMTGNLRTASEA